MMTNSLAVSVRVDKYPKSSIDVYVLVLQNDGGTLKSLLSFIYSLTINSSLGALSAAISCASLAIADAGIEMVDLVPACNAVSRIIEERYTSNGRLTLSLSVSLVRLLYSIQLLQRKSK